MIVLSAPSGSGKSTIINYLLKEGLPLEFSISATSRAPRGNEQNGKEYYFLTAEAFKQKIADDQFVEYEEVYTDNFYGTLKSEIERIQQKGHFVIFDIDVKGAINIKKKYQDEALLLFIQPPSVEELKNRLLSRGTDSLEAIEKRVDKAAFEMTFAKDFDKIIINDILDKAQQETKEAILAFINA